MLKNWHYFLFILSSVLTLGCNNLCKENGCNDKGYCYDGACICDKWYSGEDCSLQFNRHYEGDYIAELDERARVSIDSLKILVHHSIPNRIYALNGPYMDFVTDSTLMIPEQEVLIDSNWMTVVGSGKFNLNHLQFRFGEIGINDAMGDVVSIFSFSGKKLN